MKYINLFALFMLVISLYGCLSDSDADTSVGFDPVLSGAAPINGLLGNRKIEFFDNQFSFEEAASRYSSDPAEKIDFSQNQVVLLDVGRKLTGGYRIRIDGIDDIGVTLRLSATEIIPGPNCFVSQGTTAPYVFLKVLSVERVETVVMKSEVIDCDAP